MKIDPPAITPAARRRPIQTTLDPYAHFPF